MAPAHFVMVNPGSDLGIILLSWHLTGDDTQSESVSSPDIQCVRSADTSLLGDKLEEFCSHKSFLSLSMLSLVLKRSLSLQKTPSLLPM